jgi:hypothetical protein
MGGCLGELAEHDEPIVTAAGRKSKADWKGDPDSPKVRTVPLSCPVSCCMGDRRGAGNYSRGECCRRDWMGRTGRNWEWSGYDVNSVNECSVRLKFVSLILRGNRKEICLLGCPKRLDGIAATMQCLEPKSSTALLSLNSAEEVLGRIGELVG